MREDAAGFKNSVIGPQIRSQPDRDRTPVANMLDPSITYLLASGMIILAFG